MKISTLLAPAAGLAVTVLATALSSGCAPATGVAASSGKVVYYAARMKPKEERGRAGYVPAPTTLKQRPSAFRGF